MRSSSAGSRPGTPRAPLRPGFEVEWALAIAAMLAVVAVVFVARPFLRDPSPASDRLDELAPDARERLPPPRRRGPPPAARQGAHAGHRPRHGPGAGDSRPDRPA